MRKLIVSLSAAAIITGGAVAGLQAAATAAPLPHPDMGGVVAAADTPSQGDPAGLSFTTTMISYTPFGPKAAGPSPAGGYVLAGRITRDGTAAGLSTAVCTYTITRGPVLRVCTVDYALDNGLITTSGYIDGPGKDAPVTLVIDGGTGAFAGARGYGRLQPTSTGSTVTLHLAG
jgi:hypothetical protein